MHPLILTKEPDQENKTLSKHYCTNGRYQTGGSKLLLLYQVVFTFSKAKPVVQAANIIARDLCNRDLFQVLESSPACLPFEPLCFPFLSSMGEGKVRDFFPKEQQTH